MLAALLAISGRVGSGLTLWLLGLAIWLFTRPGGWAVVVVATLVALKL